MHHWPFPKLLFSTLPFWSLRAWSCFGSISCSSLTSDQSSSSSLSIFVTTVLVALPAVPRACCWLERKECLAGTCLAWTGEALLGLICTSVAWFGLDCGDLPLWCFMGCSSSMSESSSSDSSSELKGGVLKGSQKRGFTHHSTFLFFSNLSKKIKILLTVC